MFMYANVYKYTKYERWRSTTHVALSCAAQERELCAQLHILHRGGKMCMGCAQNSFLCANGRTICTTHAHVTDFGKNRYKKCANVYTCVRICFFTQSVQDTVICLMFSNPSYCVFFVSHCLCIFPEVV